jgi:hypothetical protein
MLPMADSAKLRIWLNPFGDETSSEKRMSAMVESGSYLLKGGVRY